MNSINHYQPSKNFKHPCPDLATMAERELTAFFNAITQLFGSEKAELSAEDWLQELVDIDGLPTTARDWRLITLNATSRLGSRVNASSLSAEFTNT
jgi:hypothetical protein